MADEILLISIRPEHANKIFGGSKKVELRRLKPKVRTGDLVLVYVSSPVQALVGAFSVGKVVEAKPQILWDQVKEIACITKGQFDDYYTGTRTAYGIYIKEVRQLPKPVKLGSLRNIFSSFHPPQSYRYVTSVEAAAIHITSHQIMKRDLLQRMPASIRQTANV